MKIINIQIKLPIYEGDTKVVSLEIQEGNDIRSSKIILATLQRLEDNQDSVTSRIIGNWTDGNEIQFPLQFLKAGNFKLSVKVFEFSNETKYLLQGGNPPKNKAASELTSSSVELTVLYNISQESTGKLVDKLNDVKVGLQRSASDETNDTALWDVIRHISEQTSFEKFQQRMNDATLILTYTDAYDMIFKKADRFLKETADINSYFRDKLDDNKRLSKLDNHFEVEGTRYFTDLPPEGKLKEIKERDEDAGNFSFVIPEFYTSLNRISQINSPYFVELIWSYWHEESGLVQAFNAICRRFQNAQTGFGKSALDRLDVHPLRPVSNLLWGYIQKEYEMLTLKRRAYEYSHQYGFTLRGKAVTDLSPVDNRSRFLDAFHSLLQITTVYFRDSDDVTKIADAFPLLNALKEVHMILAEGAHNQYGSMAWKSRVEMLTQQWILAQPEFGDFLGGRKMTPYQQKWMDRVDTMHQIIRWPDVSVIHFHNLAVWGERILLSIRMGDWNNTNKAPDSAANWAKTWRNEIQGYIHSYRVATSVDIAVNTPQNISLRATSPSILLERKIARV
jgi:hypothetical protein